MKTRLAMLAISLTSTMAIAGSKQTGGSVFVPEIGYTYNSSRSSDLRLSNREGTAAILVYRAPIRGGIWAFDLAPQGVNRIAFVEEDANAAKVLKLTTWRTDEAGNVKVAIPQQLDFGTGKDNLRDVEFSPDGQKLAFWLLGNGLDRVSVHDFATGETTILAEGTGGRGLSWHPSGKFIYFHRGRSGGNNEVIRIPTDQGQQTNGVTVASYGEIHDVDTSRPGTTGDANGFMVSYRSTVDLRINTAFYSDDGTTATLSKIYTGPTGAVLPSLLGHYNCDNTKFIYRISSTRDRHVAYYDIATRQVTTFSTDSNISWTDWMPCASPHLSSAP
jgi:hypothetical protein